MKMMQKFSILGFFEISILCSCFICSLCYFRVGSIMPRMNLQMWSVLDAAVSGFNLFELVNCVQ
jgi:hypothetical protein